MDNQLILQAKKLPFCSGVYLFLSKNNSVLYVGRAVSLRKRILNYFQQNLDPRIKEMVSLSTKIKHYKTQNLLEAVILEANLIKKYWPKYNIRDRDDRSFAYIVILKQKFTRPIIIRGQELKKISLSKAEIFGPYKSLSLATSILKIIRKIFPYSDCQINSGKACFNYQINLCPGACIGIISNKDYDRNITNIVLLLKGRKKALLKKLKKENPEKIKMILHLQDVALISKDDYHVLPQTNRIEAYDISHFSGKETYGAMVVFENNKPAIQNYRLFKIKKSPASDDLRALEEMIIRRFNHLEWRYPDLIVIDGGKPQIDYLTKILQKQNINIPFLGISKYQNDKIIFPKKTKKSFKDLISNNIQTLLKAREEAHRFSNKASQKGRRLLKKD